jgi:hypothetical protein
MPIVMDGEFVELTMRDRQAFANALLNPVPPSDRAVANALWYQKIMPTTKKSLLAPII